MAAGVWDRRQDRVIIGELLSTLSAVFDFAELALVTDDVQVAAHCRTVADAQLQVCARLLAHLHSGAKLDQVTAAAAGHPSDSLAAAVVISEGGQ